MKLYDFFLALPSQHIYVCTPLIVHIIVAFREDLSCTYNDLKDNLYSIFGFLTSCWKHFSNNLFNIQSFFSLPLVCFRPWDVIGTWYTLGMDIVAWAVMKLWMWFKVFAIVNLFACMTFWRWLTRNQPLKTQSRSYETYNLWRKFVVKGSRVITGHIIYIYIYKCH